MGGPGTVKLTAVLHRLHWVSGQRCFVKALVSNNTTRTIKSFTLTLIRRVTTFKSSAAVNIDGRDDPDACQTNTSYKEVAQSTLETSYRVLRGYAGSKGWWTGVNPGENAVFSHYILIPVGPDNAARMPAPDKSSSDSQMRYQFLAEGYWKSSTIFGQLSLVPYPQACSPIFRSGLSISPPSTHLRLIWTPTRQPGQHHCGQDTTPIQKLATTPLMSSLMEGGLDWGDLLGREVMAHPLPEAMSILMQKLIWWFGKQARNILKHQHLRNLSVQLVLARAVREVRRLHRSRKAAALLSSRPQTNAFRRRQVPLSRGPGRPQTLALIAISRHSPAPPA
jgi:hypothetical protein